jgi:radical SAM protein with 4Fe4S-binding SPASM domain
MFSSRHHIPFVVFELTDACNQKCKFCYNYWKGDGSKACVPRPDFRLARRTLKRLLRQAKVGSLSFSGGEPMLMPRIHELTLKARFAGANVNLLSNGTLIKDTDLEIMNQLGVGTIQVPILAAESSLHDCTTGLKGSWQKAVDSARKISATKSEWLLPVLIVSKLNIHCIEDILRFYHSEFGAVRAMVNRFNIGGLGKLNALELNLTTAELKDAFARVDKVAGELGMTIQSGVCTPMCVLDPDDYPNIVFSHCSTDLSHRPLTVNYKGDVRFCNHSPRVLGNIYDKSIGQIVAESQGDGYFDKIPTPCDACKLWSRCRGGCRAASEQLYGTFDKVDPILHDAGPEAF